MISSLYIITNAEQASAGCGSVEEAVNQALQAGARLVQLRDKQSSPAHVLKLAKRLVPLAHEHNAKLLINTHLDVAKGTGADGLHRPATGPSVAEIRRQFDREIIVGTSTHSLAEARRAQSEGADFITLSPIFETASKPGYGPALGLDELARICRAIDLPVYALAGITPERVEPCLAAGVHGVAVMGGIMRSGDPAAATRAYLDALELR